MIAIPVQRPRISPLSSPSTEHSNLLAPRPPSTPRAAVTSVAAAGGGRALHARRRTARRGRRTYGAHTRAGDIDEGDGTDGEQRATDGLVGDDRRGGDDDGGAGGREEYDDGASTATRDATRSERARANVPIPWARSRTTELDGGRDDRPIDERRRARDETGMNAYTRAYSGQPDTRTHEPDRTAPPREPLSRACPSAAARARAGARIKRAGASIPSDVIAARGVRRVAQVQP